MHIMSLTLKKKADFLYILSPPLIFRIVFFLSAFILGLSLFFSRDSQSSSLFGMILIGICVLSMLYQDKWSFNNKTGILISQTGFLFLFKSHKFHFNDIAYLEIIIIKKKIFSKKEIKLQKKNTLQKLSLRTKQGKSFVIDYEGNYDRLKSKALLLSGFCNIPLKYNEIPD